MRTSAAQASLHAVRPAAMMRPQLTQAERDLFVVLCHFAIESRAELIRAETLPFSEFGEEDWERCLSVIQKLEVLAPPEDCIDTNSDPPPARKHEGIKKAFADIAWAKERTSSRE